MAHAILERSASGLRHLRWTREVLGALDGLLDQFGAHMSEAQHAALAEEAHHVSELLRALSSAVKLYRDFLERTRAPSRGRLRAAEVALAGDTGFTSPPEPEAAKLARAGAQARMENVIEPDRQQLHASLVTAIDALRDGLRAMDERLERHFSKALVEGIYPALTDDRSRVRDDGDPDDDAAGA